MRSEDEQTRALYELSSMIINTLRYPPLPVPFPIPNSTWRRKSEVSPAAFASLFMGISMALMLFGSVIFLVGFILMPWVVGLAAVFYLVEMISSLSNFTCRILFRAASPKSG